MRLNTVANERAGKQFQISILSQQVHKTKECAFGNKGFLLCGFEFPNGPKSQLFIQEGLLACMCLDFHSDTPSTCVTAGCFIDVLSRLGSLKEEWLIRVFHIQFLLPGFFLC